MSILDIFKTREREPERVQIADSQKDKDKSIAAAGSIFYVKWTDKSCTMSDTVKFYNERESRIFVNECKAQGYYVNSWVESRDAQVQAEVERIRQELEQIYQKDIDRLKYKLHGLKTDCKSLQASAAYKSDVGKLQSRVNALTSERDSLKHQIKQLQEQVSALDKDKDKAPDHKQVKTWARKIIAALDCSKVQSLAQELEQDKDFASTKGNLQGRLIAYYAHKIIDT